MKQTFVKAAVMACFMAAVSCGQAPTAMGPAEYAVMTIATTDREIPINYSATIRGRQDIAIYPQVSGTIFELCVNEGQTVSKGQPLFIIDQVPYKAALQTAEANVAAAKAGVATAQLTYDSKKDIYRIPGSAVTGDITVTVTKGAPVEVSTYVTLDNQSMYLVIYTGNVEDGHVPMYDGQNMYWSKVYNAYAWLVISSADEKEVAQAAQNSITIGEGKAAATVDYSGNVDLSGRIDVDDVHLAHDVYNARYTLVSLMMHKFLNADVNRDRKVDVKDAVWIVNRILSGQQGA